jgi:O-antigen/teichoic acid export membrane protein
MEYIRYGLRLSLPYVPHIVSMYVLSASDKLVIQHLCGDTAVAFYSIGFTCAVVISMLINWLLNSLWLSILYSAGGRGYLGWAALRGPSYLVEAPANILLGYLLLKGLDKAKLQLK